MPVLLPSLLLLISSQMMVKGAVSHLPMDMALHSFDDQYLGCREQVMEELEQGDYFQKEIAANKDYLSLWKKAQEALLKSPVGLLREMRDSHAIVLMAYSMNSSLHSQMNWATSTSGSSPEHYRHNFSFKYFHFYLTTAIQIMNQRWSSKESMGKRKCYQVYRGVKDLYIEAMVGSRVRFGRFTSASRLWNQAQKFGNETLFTVTTCLGAALQGFSYYTSEKEVLIPPYEVFLVKSFFRTQHGNRLHLHSVGNYSKYHCQLVEACSSPAEIGTFRMMNIQFIKTDIPWTHSGGRAVIYGLSEVTPFTAGLQCLMLEIESTSQIETGTSDLTIDSPQFYAFIQHFWSLQHPRQNSYEVLPSPENNTAESI